MRKGVLELCILSILSGRDAYVSDLIKALKEADLLVVEGTLYPLLTRLKNEGHLSYRWEESKSGPPRKYYRLTASGETFREQLTSSWIDLSEKVDRIINLPNPNSETA